RPIHTPEDMAGLTFRTMQVPMYMMIVESLGGRPTPIEWTEVYSALETGIADGQENPFQSVIVASLYEVQDYMTLDGHVLTYKVFCVNEDWYQSLNDDMKQILHHAARDGNRASYVIGRMADVLGYDDLTSKGMEIYTPKAEEMELFKEATIPTAKEYLSEKYGMEEIDKLLNAIEESEKALGYK
ncbi:MAG: TRAP transporter substrate-binding protein DctP, partial [Atribacterota bacterium]|nr:TRAP transporter substrate-binding protein DctP [Atribacterota bacterium]